jgi:hypothetical protein
MGGANSYTKKDALERIAEEVERTAWALDREFGEANPDRRYWLRPAQPSEIYEEEVASGKARPEPPPGTRRYTLVVFCAPGVRMRHTCVYGPEGESWRDLTEEYCRGVYDSMVRNTEHGPLCADIADQFGKLELTPRKGRRGRYSRSSWSCEAPKAHEPGPTLCGTQVADRR